jgi:hypothetical protein
MLLMSLELAHHSLVLVLHLLLLLPLLLLVSLMAEVRCRYTR